MQHAGSGTMDAYRKVGALSGGPNVEVQAILTLSGKAAADAGLSACRSVFSSVEDAPCLCRRNGGLPPVSAGGGVGKRDAQKDVVASAVLSEAGDNTRGGQGSRDTVAGGPGLAMDDGRGGQDGAGSGVDESVEEAHGWLEATRALSIGERMNRRRSITT